MYVSTALFVQVLIGVVENEIKTHFRLKANAIRAQLDR